MRPKAIIKHSAQAILEGALISMLVVGLMAGTAFAGKNSGGRNGGTTGGTGQCAVNPSPVAVGADYTITATGLGAGKIVNLMIKDASVVSSWNLQADATGSLSLTWHSYWTGTSTVAIQAASGKRGTTTLASCSFVVD